MNLEEILKLTKEKISLLNEIKVKRNAVSSEVVENFNNYLTSQYLQADLTSTFAKEDKEFKNFKIKYSPISVGISAERINKSGELEVYNPGSMARQTVWQALTYFSIINYIKNNFNGLPFLPIIIIDAIEQPFTDGTNISEIYQLFRKLSKELNIQLIIFSKYDNNSFETSDKINLNIGGLNPFINLNE